MEGGKQNVIISKGLASSSPVDAIMVVSTSLLTAVLRRVGFLSHLLAK